MNYFEEIKQYLKPTQVVLFYLGEGKYKGGSYWYKSPFRNEKTASFCVNNKKGIHDFGDSSHYDVISFTKKLFNIGSMQAIRRLIKDFSLPINIDQKKPQMFLEKDLIRFKKKMAERELLRNSQKQYYENIYGIACDNFKKWNNFIFDLQGMREVIKAIDLHRLYTLKAYYENICDMICNSSVEEVWNNKDFFEEVIL